MIDREEASVKFDGSDVIESGDTVNRAIPSVVVAEAEIVSEAVVPASVEVNGDLVAVTFDETVVVVNGRPVIVTAKESTIEIKREEVL